MKNVTKLFATTALALVLGGFATGAQANDASLGADSDIGVGVSADSTVNGHSTSADVGAHSSTAASAAADDQSASAALDSATDANAALDDNNGTSVSDAGGGFLNLGTEADGSNVDTSGPIDLVSDTAGGVGSTVSGAVNGLLSKL